MSVVNLTAGIDTKWDMFSRIPWWGGYATAIAAVVIVTFAHLLLEWASSVPLEAPYLLFALAVVAAAWIGGLGPALLATLLSIFCIVYFFLEPRSSLTIDATHHYTSLGFYAIQGVILAVLGESNLRTLRGYARLTDELELRVEQRTSELASANDQLMQEVRERRQAEQRIEAAMVELQRSNEGLQDFASVASHDLQEPLRKIQAFSDRLLKTQTDQLSAQGRDYLERMNKAASRMGTLIDDLLTFSRVMTQSHPFTIVDLAEVAREVVDDLEHRLESCNGRIEIGHLPLVHADRTQMRQLLQNLLSNGLKFHRPEVAPLVRIAEVEADQTAGNNEIRFAVSDNGVGFDEKYADRIFGIFQRLYGKGKYEGTGIGLAVCRKIVEHHGGQIIAHSTPGVGSTFTVTLPRQMLSGQITHEQSQTNHHPAC